MIRLLHYTDTTTAHHGPDIEPRQETTLAPGGDVAALGRACRQAQRSYQQLAVARRRYGRLLPTEMLRSDELAGLNVARAPATSGYGAVP